jgi:hypothetical protein
MRRAVIISAIIIFLLAVLPVMGAYADSRDILKQGLLGAGAGAVGGAASGAKGKDVWKGALAGAGVNIVGGALLDSMSGEKVKDVNEVDSQSARSAYSDGYEDGYQNGYKKGYTDGYKEGLSEAYKE